MIVCPLCGNCTDNKDCEVCGIKLYNESSAGEENIPVKASEYTYYKDDTSLNTSLFHIDIKNS